MSSLKGAEALALHKKLKEENANTKVADLDAAKALAAQQGKEPFDLPRLETLCDTSQAGRLAQEKDRQATYEYLYYVEHKNVRTLPEFAAIVAAIASWP
jgi:hypothetical protein